jgi:hypothetical protein
MRHVDFRERGEPLDTHPIQIPVRHGMPDQRDPQAGIEQ